MNNKVRGYGVGSIDVSDCEIHTVFKRYFAAIRLSEIQRNIVRQGIRSGGVSGKDLAYLTAGYVIPRVYLSVGVVDIETIQCMVSDLDFGVYANRGYKEALLKFLKEVISFRRDRTPRDICYGGSINQRYHLDCLDSTVNKQYNSDCLDVRRHHVNGSGYAYMQRGSTIVQPQHTPLGLCVESQPSSVNTPSPAVVVQPQLTAKPDKRQLVVKRQTRIQYTGALNTHECVVCQEWMADTLLMECGHIVMCTKCAKKTFKTMNTCPMCRETVIQVGTIPAFNYTTPLAAVESGPSEAAMESEPSTEPVAEPLAEPVAEPLAEPVSTICQ